MKLKFTKIRDVKSPEKGTKGSLGYDFFLPTLNEEMIDLLHNLNKCFANVKINKELSKSLIIPPHTDILIPSGIHIKTPLNTGLLLINKSGVALKQKFDILACLIDEDYEGEVHFHLLNTSAKIIEINNNQKIVQGIIIPNYNCSLKEVDNIDNLYKGYKSERKGGNFGSTGI